MEQFTIFNNYFTSLATQAFKKLLDDQNYADVKLLTSDNKQITAHKVVLGTSSTFFKNIFAQNTDQNLLIYMKGISYKELSWIMNFIYLGQCKVEQTEMKRFISIRKELEVESFQEEEKKNNHNKDVNNIENVVDKMVEEIYNTNFEQVESNNPISHKDNQNVLKIKKR